VPGAEGLRLGPQGAAPGEGARRARGFRTIRIDAETAQWLDLLARHKGLGSRAEAVEEMVRVTIGAAPDPAAD
jgi:hypothetical protein